MPESALIVVDMLNDFINENGALYCGPTTRKIISFIRDRLVRYRRTNDLIIYLQDAHHQDDLEFEQFPPHCIAGTWGSEIIAELTPEAGEQIIPKTRFSGFYNTNLESILRAANVKAVEVVGVCTSICVMDTVGGLANRDYKISVPKDCVADFDAEFHDFALKRMQRLYGAEVV